MGDGSARRVGLSLAEPKKQVHEAGSQGCEN